MSKFVTLTIDGQEVSVPEGTTIIEAAVQAEIDIPHLCYLDGLEKTGACRLCVVEVEGRRGLVVSCTMRAREGMVVRTQSEEILEARRFVLELIWSTHPGDCTTCEKSGSCELQRYTYELGIEKDRFPQVVSPGSLPIDTTNPLIEKDLNLCILCGRCIRICETQGNHVLDFVDRGIDTKVTTALDKPLQESGCTFCGSCISVCPVACLVEKDRRFRGREWEFEATQTVCAYCGCGCHLFLDTVDDQIVRARPEKRDGFLCVRGKFGWDYALSDERLKTPLVRKNGSLEACSWDEALAYIVEGLGKVKEARGPEALGGLVSAHYPNETLYLLGKFVRGCLGTNNLDSSVRLLSYPTLAGFAEAFGTAGVVPSLSDIEEADTLLVVGADVTIAYPAVGAKVKKAVKAGAQLITIDPRSTEVAGLSQLHLQPKAGAEAALMDGLIKVMLDEKLYDKEFVAAQCSNFEEFSEGLSAEDVEKKTNVAKEDLIEAARLYGESDKKAIIIFSPEASDLQTVSRIVNLLALTGRVKGGAFPCLLLSNLWGAFEAGVTTEHYPGYRKVEDAAARKELEDAWGVSLPDTPGLSAIEMIQAASSSVFGMYILGENPAASFPDTTRTVEALRSLDFLVVQDIFLTETAQLADVVLPGASFAESSGTFINAEGRTQKLNRAIPPLTRPDWEVIAELSSKMGCPMNVHSEEEIAEEMKTLVPYEVEGQECRFDMIEDGEVCEELGGEYPYCLMTGATLFGFGDGSWTRRSKMSLLESLDGGCVGISPQDAQSLGVTDGSRVSVSSPRGSVAATVEIQESLPAGLVFMPTHSPGCNILTSSRLDPATKSPRSRLSAVKIIPEVTDETN